MVVLQLAVFQLDVLQPCPRRLGRLRVPLYAPALMLLVLLVLLMLPAHLHLRAIAAGAMPVRRALLLALLLAVQLLVVLLVVLHAVVRRAILRGELVQVRSGHGRHLVGL